MAPSFCIELDAGQRRQLLGIARQSIGHGLQGTGPLPVAEDALAGALKARLGVFVTLTRNEALRGCIGSLQSIEPLARSVANSAYSAAFEDPRFTRLRVHEAEEIEVDISVLSPLEPIQVGSRRELLDMLQPGRDGLLLEDLRHRSTFLPKVWEQLPDPGQFLDQLLAKAGLPEHHWSATIRFQRYHTVSFSESTL
jgi:AmmeMemoRadiSam system protein A